MVGLLGQHVHCRSNVLFRERMVWMTIKYFEMFETGNLILMAYFI
jgi:hypothetical protein